MASEISAELWNKAFAAGSEELTRLYTKDAQIFPPGQRMVKGERAIQQAWEAIQQEYSDSRLTTTEVLECGSYMFETGTWTAKRRGSPLQGKYMSLWKKEGGTWKIHRDIWNRDTD